MTNPLPTSAAAMATANIQYRWREGERVFPVPVALGERTLLDLLPAAREISGQATGIALTQARAQGQEISCRAGCGACCRQLVAISMVEAQALAELVAALPAERQAVLRGRFADAVERLEQGGLLDPRESAGERSVLAGDLGPREATLQGVGQRYFRLQIPCPFLENEACGIYEDRPVVCREHHVSTPAENCARLYQVNVDRVEPPVRMGEVLARTADRTHGVGPFMIPLVLSLEWSLVHGPTVKQTQDGMGLFQTMMEELEK